MWIGTEWTYKSFPEVVVGKNVTPTLSGIEMEHTRSKPEVAPRNVRPLQTHPLCL